MQTILVANPKGGSGKTTVATNVAGWLAGKRQRVAIADHDPQRSATEWLARRPALFPKITGLAVDATKKALKDVDPQWLVVDTPAGLHGPDLRDALNHADVLLVPLAPSAFDMTATAHFLAAIAHYKAVKKGDIAIGIVAMRVDARTRSAAELDEFLKAFDVPAGRASARYAGLRALRARRRDGVRPAALARRAGLGAVEAADALDRASGGAEVRLTLPACRKAKRRREAGVFSCGVTLRYFFGAIESFAAPSSRRPCVASFVAAAALRAASLDVAAAALSEASLVAACGLHLRVLGGSSSLVGGFLSAIAARGEGDGERERGQKGDKAGFHRESSCGRWEG